MYRTHTDEGYDIFKDLAGLIARYQFKMAEITANEAVTAKLTEEASGRISQAFEKILTTNGLISRKLAEIERNELAIKQLESRVLVIESSSASGPDPSLIDRQLADAINVTRKNLKDAYLHQYQLQSAMWLMIKKRNNLKEKFTEVRKQQDQHLQDMAALRDRLQMYSEEHKTLRQSLINKLQQAELACKTIEELQKKLPRKEQLANALEAQVKHLEQMIEDREKDPKEV